MTLIGRGGIGKTSLALKVLHDLSSDNRYDLIIWFSARDIELSPNGPKQVRPRAVDVIDLATQYASLISSTTPEDPVNFLARELSGSELGRVLFGFDNFETVTSSVEVYTWIDTHIRPPNKALITTRYREFRGDYPIEVRGMNEDQCNLLIDATSGRLGIRELISREYRQRLLEEAGGHPYVIKVLLGEVARARAIAPVQRVMAGKEEILIALFERTYNSLPPSAQRLFLTLSNWNSAVPRIALQAVMLRLRHDFVNVDDALETLQKSSFVDVEVSEADGQEFLQVPLVATLFGRKKLLASPYRAAVEVDTKLLHEFGATQAASIKRGIELHVRRFTAYVAREIEKRPEDRGEYIGMLELLARRHAVTWLDIAKLWSEMDDGGELDHAKAAVRQYLEQSGDAAGPEPWRMLADYCRSSGDIIGEIHALVELCKKADVEFHVISAWASRFNGVVAAARDVLEKDEKMMLADEIASVMEGRIDEGNATDRSRVAWLCLQLGDVERAWNHTQEGLKLDPENPHCVKLRERLG